MRLGNKQKQHLLTLISEGRETDEINRAARRFKPPYQVSRQQVDHYRRTRGVKIKEIEETSENEALKEGFGNKETRISALDEIAQALKKELIGIEGRLYVSNVKMIGTGRHTIRVDYEELNEPAIRQFRGLLDDIAKEKGDRKQKVEHSGKIDVSKLSDAELEAIARGESAG